MSRLTRKTPLARTDGLSRGPAPSRKGRLGRSRPAAPDAAERELMEAFGALATRPGAHCAACGHTRKRDLEVHHVVPKTLLPPTRFTAEQRWAIDNALVLCDEPAPNRCHTRHTLAVRRVPRSALRPENLQFAEAIGLGWYIESHYPEEGRNG